MSSFVNGFNTDCPNSAWGWLLEDYDPYDSWGWAMLWASAVASEAWRRGLDTSELRYRPGVFGPEPLADWQVGLEELSDRVIKSLVTMLANYLDSIPEEEKY